MHKSKDNLGAVGGYGYHLGSMQLSASIYLTIHNFHGFFMPQSITINEFLPHMLD